MWFDSRVKMQSFSNMLIFTVTVCPTCCVWYENKYTVHVETHVHLMFTQPPHQTHTHNLTEAAESTRMFACIEVVVKLNGRGGALFLPLVEGWLVGCLEERACLGGPGR